MKTVAILQSCYIPWKGYFDLLGSVDEFIIYDSVQFTKRDWRNRNRIMTKNGLLWLTIPVRQRGRYHQCIDEVMVSDPRWADKHWRSLESSYARAPFFSQLAPALERIYKECKHQKYLSRINRLFIEYIVGLLNIKTRITSCRNYQLRGDKTERLLNICLQAEASTYLSGPAAKCYLDEKLFAEQGIAVCWMDYSGYPEYPQMHGPPFVHEVSILDLLFNVGPIEARRYMQLSAADNKAS